MTTIYARATDQVLTGTILPKVACSNRNTVQIHVDFDSTWHGYAKSAVFCTEDDPTVYEVPFSSTGNCTIPAEVLAYAGRLNIYAKGVKSASGAVKSTTPLTVRILPGTPAVIVSDPSGTAYGSMLAAYSRTADELAVERARIDNLAKMTAGSTTGDAELADIRVGADGKTYGTAGGAVRGQISPIAKQVKAKNLIDFKKLTRGYLAADGWLNNNNNGFVLNHEVTSDFIAVSAAETYYFAHKLNAISAAIRETVRNEQSANADWFCFGLYDESKTFINRITYDGSSYILPGSVFEGAAYVRVSYRTYMFNRPVFAACGVPCEAMDDTAEADNLLESYPMIFNGYVTNTSGAVIGTTHDKNGYIPTEQDERTSDFIPCEGGEKMFIYASAVENNFVRIAFYAANGYMISSFSFSPTSVDNVGAADYDNFLETFTVPGDAVALRISCRWAYITECVLARNDGKRRYLFKDCERKFSSKYDSVKLERIFAESPTMKGIAHRGLSAVAPENTLTAYRMARKAGFSHAECDVSFTADGHAVLLHDSTVDRTSNGTGSIAGITFEAVRALDFGSWKSEKYAGEQIPTFAEFISLCRNLGLHPYIELKEGTQEQIEGLVSTVKRYGMKGKVTWISFNADYLGYVKAVDPAARLGYVASYVDSYTITTIQGLQTGENEVFVDCSADSANAEAAQLCADADIPLEVWTVNSEAAILSLDPYVSGVTSDSLIAGQVLYNNNR